MGLSESKVGSSYCPQFLPTPKGGGLPYTRSEHGTELADMDALIENRVVELFR